MLAGVAAAVALAAVSAVLALSSFSLVTTSLITVGHFIFLSEIFFYNAS